jgi:hypothetical protein
LRVMRNASLDEPGTREPAAIFSDGTNVRRCDPRCHDGQMSSPLARVVMAFVKTRMPALHQYR